MECKFFVGQNVVCVDNSSGDKSGYWNPPRRGVVYTVAAIGFGDHDGQLTVWLSELSNPHHHTGQDFGYYAYRFRPATDISDRQKIVEKVFKGKKVSA